MAWISVTEDRQCTAHSKRTGERCTQWAMKGKTVCRMHGGKSRKGIQSPVIRHGRYSKVLPQNILERYEQAAADPELLSMRQEIALLDARLAQLLARLGNNESSQVWREVSTQFSSLQVAIRLQNAALLQESLISLEKLILRGGADYMAWRDIGDLIEQRRKLTESESKRLFAMKQVITSEQAMTFVVALTSAVKSHISDPRVLNAIQSEFVRLTTRSDRIALDDGTDVFADAGEGR